MFDKPPPFTALRAIEAAVRHRSYTWAAKELAITHSAVSQSIKRFEAELGTKLFSRRGGAMEPSPAALQLAQAYADAAAVVSRSLDKLAVVPAPTNLKLLVAPVFARLWLSPRLPRLTAFMDGVGVNVRTSLDEDAFDTSDLSITIGLPKGSDLSVERLGKIMLTPLCSPSFEETYQIRGPGDVLQAPLLEERAMPWSNWLKSVDMDERPGRPAQQFDDPSMLLDAAARGEGLALAPRLLAQSYLVSGALVAPLQDEAPFDEELFMAWHGRGETQPSLARLMQWMRSELASAQ